MELCQSHLLDHIRDRDRCGFPAQRGEVGTVSGDAAALVPLPIQHRSITCRFPARFGESASTIVSHNQLTSYADLLLSILLLTTLWPGSSRIRTSPVWALRPSVRDLTLDQQRDGRNPHPSYRSIRRAYLARPFSHGPGIWTLHPPR